MLEAIYVLATTRSFRTSRITECCGHEAARFDLGGTVLGRARFDLELSWSEEGRSRSLNGVESTLSEHLDVLPVVTWTSTESEVVEGGPAARRRLLDRGLVSLRPRSLETLARYRRALEHKRQLLARGEGELRPWNEVLATEAAQIQRLRSDYVDRLAAILREVLSESGLALPPVDLGYRPSPVTENGSESEILGVFERQERQERQRRMPLDGPHRDDVEILWGSHEARRVASGGEKKLLGLALTAARGRLLEAAERPPIYLLDDLDAELDRGRLTAVWGLFRGRGQVLVSSNREEYWRPLEIDARWRLEGGRVRPAEEPSAGPL